MTDVSYTFMFMLNCLWSKSSLAEVKKKKNEKKSFQNATFYEALMGYSYSIYFCVPMAEITDMFLFYFPF